MKESVVTETLDRWGRLDAARGPGCYVLEVDTPATPDAVARHWHRHHDRAPDDLYARLADAHDVYYVGAASNVYARLCDHCAADVRLAAFLEAFPPESLHSVWSYDDTETAFRKEHDVAASVAGPATRVWTDGVLL